MKAKSCGVAPRAGAGASVKLPYGQSLSGEIVHISTVENGLACNCICPGCGALLVARTRGERQPHFAHHASSECATAYETALHKLAKTVLAEHKRVTLPAVIAVHGSKQHQVRPVRSLNLDRVTWEQQIETIRPDVVAHWRDRRVLIEVKVTHGCEPAKLEYLHKFGVSAFEIDLSRVARDATLEEITHQVLDGARRYWLFHQAQIDKEEELRAAAEAEALRLEKEEEARLAAVVEKLRTEAHPFVSTYRGRTLTTAKGHPLVVEIEDAHLETAFRRPARGAKSFTVQYQIWQAALLKHYVLERKGIFFSGIRTSAAVQFLEAQDMIGTELVQFGGTSGLLQAIRDLEPDFAAPADIVDAFLNHLGTAGLLRRTYSGWEADENRAFRAREQATRSRHVREDLAVVEQIVADLARSAPPGSAFDRLKWLRSPHGKYEPSPIAVIEASGSAAGQLIRDLKKISAMLVPGGKPVADLLDLPFENERTAREQEEADALALRQLEAQQKAEAEARGRKQDLVNLAKSLLSDADSEAWWKLRGDILAMDGISEERLLVESRSIHQTSARRVQEEKHLARMAPHREALREQAQFILHNPEKAEMWVNQPNPGLGGKKPIDYCVDHEATAKCVSVLKETWSKNRR